MSPTNVSTWDECKRKWGFRYIARIYGPAGKGAELGTDAHDQLENYLRHAKPLDFTHPSGAILQVGLHLFPEPKTRGMTAETEFRFTSPHTGFKYMGKRDVLLAPGIPQPQLGFDGSAAIVEDLKTTKSIADYAKDSLVLRHDPQAVMYALDAMTLFHTNVADLAWIYVQTQGARRAHPVTLRMHDYEAREVFEAIESEVRKMHVVLADAPERDGPRDVAVKFINDVLPPNESACRNFGGCPHQSICNRSQAKKVHARMGLLSKPAASTSVAATAPATTATTAPSSPPAPNVMGCSDRDVPAATQIPAALLADPKGDEPVDINPPEQHIPVTRTDAPKDSAPAPVSTTTEERPKRHRRTKAEMEAARAADASAAQPTLPGVAVPPECMPARDGWTLFVDCMPTKGADRVSYAADVMYLAHEKVEEIAGVPDYRLIDFGKGAAHFVAAFADVFDGSRDLVLDTRTPEGAVLLESLSARAAFVVRGLR